MNINLNNEQMDKSVIGLNVSIKNQKNNKVGETQLKNGKIYAGNLKNNTQSKTEEIKEKFKKQAMEIVNKQKANEFKTSDNISELEEQIKALQTDIKTKQEDIESTKKRKKAVMEEYGIDPDSQEQKDLELLIKSKCHKNELSQEERKQVEEMGELTPYQQEILDLEEIIETDKNSISEMEQAIGDGYSTIYGIKMEKLKSHAMVDAYKAADEILKEGNAAIIQQAINDAKEHIDEEFDTDDKVEDVEEAEKEKEEKEEQAAQASEKEVTNAVNQEQIEKLQKEGEEVSEKLRALAKKNAIVPEDAKGILVDCAI